MRRSPLEASATYIAEKMDLPWEQIHRMTTVLPLGTYVGLGPSHFALEADTLQVYATKGIRQGLKSAHSGLCTNSLANGSRPKRKGT